MAPVVADQGYLLPRQHWDLLNPGPSFLLVSWLNLAPFLVDSHPYSYSLKPRFTLPNRPP